MPDCSKTEVFLKELDRMCRYYSITQNNVGEESCKNCPISIANNGRDVSCTNFLTKYPQKAIEIVRKWSDQNPIKTRQSEFLKVFPNAHLINGVINICPKTAFFDFGDCPTQKTCDNCRKEYWLTEVD